MQLLNFLTSFFIVDSKHKLLSHFIVPVMFTYLCTCCELMVVSSKYLCPAAGNH